jgi:hypothetical protein
MLTKTVCGCGGLCDSGRPCPMPKTVDIAPGALARGLADLQREMALCELTPGPAPWLRVEAVEIDRQVCADSACDRCGHAGLLYKPYHHCRGRRAYVAYSVCPSCGDWVQF